MVSIDSFRFNRQSFNRAKAMQNKECPTASETSVISPHEMSAPAQLSDMNAFAKRLQSNPDFARAFFKSAVILGEDGELAPAYCAPR